MDWIKLPEGFHNGRTHLPLDRQFFAIWRGMPCICEYDDNEELFFISFQPSSYGVMIVDRERECKFTHYCEIDIP